MKVMLSPQVRIGDNTIKYTFVGDKITATYEGISEMFDFSGVPDGIADHIESEVFSFNPVISAKKESGVLHVELLNFIGMEASHEECFPDWIEV